MDDEALWQGFTTQALPHEAWNHEAHVRVAYLHLRDAGFDLDEAHIRMRAGIIRLNERHGLVETSQRGYFETVTRAWLCLVRSAAQATDLGSSTSFVERAPELLDVRLAGRHYSAEILRSARARAMFVEPDLQPLPA